MSSSEAPPRRLRLGLVGGGRGSFIGATHRIAARFDDRFEIVAAALSADPEMAAASARDLHLDPSRCYSSYRDLARSEAARPDGAEVVAVAVPNHLHHPVAKACLEAGLDVICDKPLATSVADALDLVTMAEHAGRFLGVTYNYTGYPMVREARALVASGAIGAVRSVQVEFVLGWLSRLEEAEPGSKQAAWRTDPERAGPSFVTADLGTHCIHLAEYVTGRKLMRLAADLATVVPGRRLEDDAELLLRFDNGARGVLWASMVAAGETVGFRLRVYGETGHVAWDQACPNDLRLAMADGVRILTRGGPGLSPAASRATRMVAGLPEGYYEAFAVLYADYAELIAARRAGRKPDPLATTAPTGADGLDGCRFVEAALASHRAGGGWVDV